MGLLGVDDHHVERVLPITTRHPPHPVVGEREAAVGDQEQGFPLRFQVANQIAHAVLHQVPGVVFILY